MPASKKERLFANAPLVEVIAEVRWHTVALTALPGSSVDPFFGPTTQQFAELAATSGYGVVEELVPREVPRELLGGTPVFRYRKQPNTWPLFQLGPGLFTANIAPPYKGWSSFEPELKLGLGILLKAYPSASTLLKLSNVTLRYIDAFTTAHSRRNAYDFLKSGLGIGLELPQGLAKAGITAANGVALELQFTVASPRDSGLTIKIGQGKKENFDATIVDFGLSTTASGLGADLGAVTKWFRDAQATLSEAFDAMTSEEVKKLMGPEQEL